MRKRFFPPTTSNTTRYETLLINQPSYKHATLSYYLLYNLKFLFSLLDTFFHNYFKQLIQIITILLLEDL